MVSKFTNLYELHLSEEHINLMCSLLKRDAHEQEMLYPEDNRIPKQRRALVHYLETQLETLRRD